MKCKKTPSNSGNQERLFAYYNIVFDCGWEQVKLLFLKFKQVLVPLGGKGCPGEISFDGY